LSPSKQANSIKCRGTVQQTIANAIRSPSLAPSAGIAIHIRPNGHDKTSLETASLPRLKHHLPCGRVDQNRPFADDLHFV
jgi:hypothetical protein